MLLVDGEQRILLLRYLDPPGGPEDRHYWLTPGGGVNRRETLAEAASRELREEIGLVVAAADLGPRVAVTSGYADLGWARGRFRDDFFLHRVAAHEVDFGGLDTIETEMVTGYRWWTVDELGTAGEPVYPLGLAPLLTGLLAGVIPSDPVPLPWHH